MKFFLFILLIASRLFSTQCYADPDPKIWHHCDRNIDCVSIDIGCLNWQSIHQNHAVEFLHAHAIPVKKCMKEGSPPLSACVENECKLQTQIQKK